MKKIKTFIINLKIRVEKRHHVLNEFKNKDEFDVTIIEAIEHELGSTGLWLSIKSIILEAITQDYPYILICEDDHQFTEHYHKEVLFNCIEASDKLEANILLGGISGVHSIFQINDKLIWVEKFSGTQFMIVYKRFYKSILLANFEKYDVADYKLSIISSNNFVVYPFISTQLEFGYSDASPRYNLDNIDVNDYFKNTSKNIEILLEGQKFHEKCRLLNIVNKISCDFQIPTYLYTDKLNSINWLQRAKLQFKHRKEFLVRFKINIPLNSKWESLQECIRKAINDKDDIIIICNESLTFTKDYSKKKLLDNILLANEQGADMVVSNTLNDFSYAIKVSNELYWVNKIDNPSLIIIYKRFFDRILSQHNLLHADFFDLLSSLSNNKFTFFPFIIVEGFTKRNQINIFNIKKYKQINLSNKLVRSIERFSNLNYIYSKFEQ